MRSVTVKLIGKVPTGFKLNMNHPQIASGMQEGYRATAFGSKTGSASFGKDPRRIYTELGKISNLKSNKTQGGDVTTTGRVPVPWAAIQDQGGVIPARSARRRGGKMKMIYHGKLIFARRVRASRITGKHYIERGFDVLRRKFKLVVESVTTWRTL
jgi:hypothetical protein